MIPPAPGERRTPTVLALALIAACALIGVIAIAILLL